MNIEQGPRFDDTTETLDDANNVERPIEQQESEKGIFWLSVELPQELREQALYERQPHSHVTLQFAVERSLLQDKEGETFPVSATAIVHNDRIQAIKVELPEEVKELCTNANPHITLSHKDGVPPFESNAMLTDPESIVTPIDPPIELTSEMEFFKFQPKPPEIKD